MNRKPVPETSIASNSLTRQIIADMKLGEERAERMGSSASPAPAVDLQQLKGKPKQ